MNVHLLRDNFQELFHAINTSKPNGLPLVANISGTRLYNSNFGWGKIWRYFYQISEWLTGQHLRLDRVKSAVLHTHKLFLHQLPIAIAHLAAYQSYLERAGKNYPVNENEIHLSRKVIVQWKDSVTPFLKLSKRCQNVRIDSLLKYCFDTQLPLPVLFSFEQEADLKFCHKIIKLEGLSQASVPLAIFKKLLKKKQLDPFENKALDKWIRKINKTSDSISEIHAALSSVVNFYLKNKGDPFTALTSLEVFLEEKGCEIFQQSDLKQIAWRYQLRKGSQIQEGMEKGIILGNELHPSISKRDKTRIFTIQNQNNLVALIPQNKVILDIKKYKQTKNESNEIALTPILEIAKNGSFGLMERLQPIDEIKWKSTNKTLNSNDKKVIDGLTKVIQSFVKHNYTPSNFASSLLMLDNKNELKALKETKKDAFNFTAIEDFIFNCASGNRYIFQYLMVETGLYNHPCSKFYLEVIKNTLKEDLTAIDDLAGIYRIGDPKIVDRGNTLALNTLALYRQLLYHFRKLFPEHDLKILTNKIKDSLLSCYLESKASGILWPQLRDDVIETIQKII